MFSAVFDSLPAAVLVLNEERQITHANRAAEALFGRSLDDLVTRSTDELLPNARVALRKNGAEIGVSATHSVFRVNGINHSAVVLRQADAPDELAHRLIHNCSDAVVIHSPGPALVVRSANAPAALLFGVAKPEDLFGRSLADFVHPEEASDIPNTQRGFEAHGSSPKAFDAGEWRLVNAQGSISVVQVRSLRVSFESEETVSFIRDVTEEQRARSQLIVSERLASVGTLAAGFAHELRTPLAAVVGNLELAGGRLAELSAAGERIDDIVGEVSDAREAAERLRELVRDLSIFSRADDEKRSVDLRSVFDSSIRMAWHEIRGKARLVRQLEELPAIIGNESRLGQLFLNLLVNAAQAIPEGDPEHQEIRLSAVVDSLGRVEVSVSDTGVGIPTHLLPRLFTPFFTTKPVGVGTGLGLSICHRIVTSLGGEIRCESRLGEGTTFRVTLPPADASAPARKRVSSPGPQPTAPVSRRTILIVDDEPVILSLVRRILKTDDVEECTRGADAVALLATRRFDIIICDLAMPGGGGDELYRALEAKDPDQAKRFMLLTGGSYSEKARTLIEARRIPVLVKPFTPDELKTAVRRLVERSTRP